MNGQKFQSLLQELIDQASYLDDEGRDDLGIGGEWENASTRTFADAGLLTRDKGIVVKLANGDEFQMTIVQSKWGEDLEEDEEAEDEAVPV